MKMQKMTRKWRKKEPVARAADFKAKSQDAKEKTEGREAYMFGGLGVPELIIILVVVLIIFGPKNLPKLGSSIGKTVNNFRKESEAKGTDDANASETAAKPANTTEKTEAAEKPAAEAKKQEASADESKTA